MPSLLESILEDATTYFLAIFTSQVLVVLFELVAPVSGRPVDTYSSAHNEPHPGADPTSSRKVRLHPRYFDDGFDRVLCRVQWDSGVGPVHCLVSGPWLTLPWDSLIPLMVTRLILSLKKAANYPGSIWDSSVGQLETAVFAQRTIGGSERGGNVALSDTPLGGRSGSPLEP